MMLPLRLPAGRQVAHLYWITIFIFSFIATSLHSRKVMKAQSGAKTKAGKKDKALAILSAFASERPDDE